MAHVPGEKILRVCTSKIPSIALFVEYCVVLEGMQAYVQIGRSLYSICMLPMAAIEPEVCVMSGQDQTTNAALN